MVDALATATSEGKAGDGGFKSSVWTAISQGLEDPLKNERVCRTRWDKIKADYKIVKFIRELSGFGWDEEKHLATAEQDVWESFQKVW